jgi:cell division protein FtsL
VGNLARKYQHQQEKHFEQQKHGQVLQPKKEKRFSITPGEKGLGLIFGAMLCFGAFHMISAQASIYEVNKDIVSMEKTMGEQKKVNNDLKMQVSELSTYERIWEKARDLGLKLNENNVKVVRDK